MDDSGTTDVTRTSDARDPQDRNADLDGDLGFGSVVAKESRRRLLNRDGSFNVARNGLGFWESVPLYHLLVTVSWPRFLALLVLGFFLANGAFAALYVWLGPDALSGVQAPNPAGRFAESFFFSVHTLSTIGYGHVVPQSFGANLLVVAESVVGVLALAIIAGIVFARFSRPSARIIFSDRALIAPYGDKTGLMFRIANQRSSQLVEISAKILFTCRSDNGKREFTPLRLERDRVVFFPLTWTVVHPIDESSPLHGLTMADLERGDAEFLILITAFDEIHSQTVHTRSSYKPDEVVFGARFRSVFNPTDGLEAISVDIEKIHDYDVVV